MLILIPFAKTLTGAGKKHVEMCFTSGNTHCSVVSEVTPDVHRSKQRSDHLFSLIL